MRKLTAVALVIAAQTFGALTGDAIRRASAAELTLNDLPAVLNTLKDCGRTPCQLAKTFAAVDPDGTVTIFFKRETGLNITGQGATVGAAVRSLAVKLNETGNEAKEAVRRIAPLLPSQ